jgi:hypothetical protein
MLFSKFGGLALSAIKLGVKLRWSKRLWIANVFLLVLLLVSFLVIDLNDHYPGLTQQESRLARYVWDACGIAISLLLVMCRSKTTIAMLFLLAFLVLGIVLVRM